MRSIHLFAIRFPITNSVFSALLLTVMVISAGFCAEPPTTTTADDSPGQIKIIRKQIESADTPGAVPVSQYAGENFKWTLEKMLMATPMPLTQEERTFLAEHPNLDGVRSWKFELFQNYASSELGRHHIAETAVHWRGVVERLKKQMTAGAKLLKLKPLPLEAEDESLNSSSLEHMQALLAGLGSERVFKQMKAWRQEVSILAPFVESMRDKAKASGLEGRFEQVLDDD